MARRCCIIICTMTAWLLIPAFATAGDRAAPDIAIEYINNAPLGSSQVVSLTGEDYPFEQGGFDFLIAYDVAGLTCDEVTPGDLLDTCDWEYFTYRFAPGDCGESWCSGLIRITAVADIDYGPYHPVCYGPPDTDPHELARISLVVTSDHNFEGQYIPIQFFWGDCGDNSISSVDGEALYIDRAIYDFEDNIIWNEEDDTQFPEDARPLYVGTPDSCTVGERLVCGDANGDGLTNVGDAVAIINFVFRGGPAPDPVDAGDANGDGDCNVGDAVYDINFVFNFGPPPVCPPIMRAIDYHHGGISISAPGR